MSVRRSLRGLSPEFRSFYRLFRRACSASVLHRTPEAVALRNLYRPTFRRAALVHNYIQDQRLNDDLKRERDAWFKVWNHRMDNTLSLLYNSSHTRGLPHTLTKFLGHFIYHERLRHWEAKNRALSWNPHLPKESHQYKPSPAKPSKAQRQIKETMVKDFSDHVLAPFREVIRLAEGRDEISLGNLKNYTRVKHRKPLSRSLTSKILT